jgi:hypothetical protein
MSDKPKHVATSFLGRGSAIIRGEDQEPIPVEVYEMAPTETAKQYKQRRAAETAARYRLHIGTVEAELQKLPVTDRARRRALEFDLRESKEILAGMESTGPRK